MNSQNQQAQQLASGAQPQVKNSTDIDMGSLIEEWKTSSGYAARYTTDFPQLDNLVDGVPINRDNSAPFVGDTTLAGLVRSIPRDSLQQLPVFSAMVNGTKNSIPALMCTYLLKKFVFNEDTFGKGLLSTLQMGAEQAITHGYAPFMVATGMMYNDFGTTMRLLHYMDTSPEPGISDANESSYHYVTANLPKSKVQRMLRKAKKNPDTNWDTSTLERVLEQEPKPRQWSIYESAPRQNQAAESMSPTYQFVTRYETGKDGTIITFCPDAPEAPLRVLDNYSKWGYPRVMYLVIDPAPLTPFGISRVRLASPNQNLMNIYYGHIASMLLLNSKPPIFKRGKFATPVTLKQGVIWETLDPNASADLKTIDNGSLQFFPQMAQQFAGQIQNIMGGQTPQINGTNNKSGFGKTGPGVKAATDQQDTNTNQITKILENLLRQYGLVGLDTLFSEQEGIDRIIVDDDTKNAINQLSPGAVGDDNKVEMNWQEFYQAIEEWSVEISVSVSKDELDEKKRGDLQDMLVVIGQNIDKLGPDAQQTFEKLTNTLMQDKTPLVKPLSPAIPQQQPSTPETMPMLAPGTMPAQA